MVLHLINQVEDFMWMFLQNTMDQTSATSLLYCILLLSGIPNGVERLSSEHQMDHIVTQRISQIKW